MIKKKCKYLDSVWQKWWAWRPIWLETISPDGKKYCTTMVWREWVWRCRKDFWSSSWWDYSLTKPTGPQLNYPYNKIAD